MLYQQLATPLYCPIFMWRCQIRWEENSLHHFALPFFGAFFFPSFSLEASGESHGNASGRLYVSSHYSLGAFSGVERWQSFAFINSGSTGRGDHCRSIFQFGQVHASSLKDQQLSSGLLRDHQSMEHIFTHHRERNNFWDVLGSTQ
jgi:hypothetical protein